MHKFYFFRNCSVLWKKQGYVTVEEKGSELESHFNISDIENSNQEIAILVGRQFDSLLVKESNQGFSFYPNYPIDLSKIGSEILKSGLFSVVKYGGGYLDTYRYTIGNSKGNNFSLFIEIGIKEKDFLNCYPTLRVVVSEDGTVLFEKFYGDFSLNLDYEKLADKMEIFLTVFVNNYSKYLSDIKQKHRKTVFNKYIKSNPNMYNLAELIRVCQNV